MKSTFHSPLEIRGEVLSKEPRVIDEKTPHQEPHVDTSPPKEGKMILTQDLIGSDKKNYGVIEMSEGNIAVTFKPPIPNNPSIIDNFLRARILDGMIENAKENGKTLEYTISEDKGKILGLHIIGGTSEKNMRDLISPCAWAAKTATAEQNNPAPQ